MHHVIGGICDVIKWMLLGAEASDGIHNIATGQSSPHQTAETALKTVSVATKAAIGVANVTGANKATLSTLHGVNAVANFARVPVALASLKQGESTLTNCVRDLSQAVAEGSHSVGQMQMDDLTMPPKIHNTKKKKIFSPRPDPEARPRLRPLPGPEPRPWPRPRPLPWPDLEPRPRERSHLDSLPKGVRQHVSMTIAKKEKKDPPKEPLNNLKEFREKIDEKNKKLYDEHKKAIDEQRKKNKIKV